MSPVESMWKGGNREIVAAKSESLAYGYIIRLHHLLEGLTDLGNDITLSYPLPILLLISTNHCHQCRSQSWGRNSTKPECDVLEHKPFVLDTENVSMGMLNKPDTWKHAQYLLGTFFSFLSQVALVSRTNVRSWDPNVRCRPLWPPLTLPLLPCLTLPPAACQRPKCQPCAQQCTAFACAASEE